MPPKLSGSARSLSARKSLTFFPLRYLGCYRVLTKHIRVARLIAVNQTQNSVISNPILWVFQCLAKEPFPVFFWVILTRSNRANKQLERLGIRTYRKSLIELRSITKCG